MGRLGSVSALLSDPLIFGECKDFLQQFLKRKLPKPDRANDAVAELVLGLPGAQLRDRAGRKRSIGVPYLFIDEPMSPDDPHPERLRRTLARELQVRGMVAVMPRADEADWHLGWPVADTWTLVNTSQLTPSTEEAQLRNLLGTTLRQYQLHLDNPPALVVLVDRLPQDVAWIDLYADYGISLIEEAEIAAWLDGAGS